MLTVNELFSGIGSQRAALERLGIEHEVVGIAEIDRFATLSYAAIYNGLNNKIKDYDFPSGIEMVDYLKEKNIGFDFKQNKPFSWERMVNKRTGKANKKLKQHYLASALSNNYGDIGKIDKLDYADFWTYSFPCQDISVAGKQAGIKHGKTRSGLLYEVERLLEAAQEHDELPKYLMLENVKNLVGKKFKPQFEEWILRLDELGYNTYWQVLNAKNYGIPQNRERVFGISIRKDIDTGYVFPEPFELKTRLKDILEDEVDEKFYISEEKTEKLISQLKNKVDTAIGVNMSNQATVLDKETDIASALLARDYKGFGNQSMTGVCIPCITPDRVEKRQNGRRFKEDGDPMFTLTGQDRHGILTGDYRYDEGLRIRKEEISPCLTTSAGGTSLSGNPLIITNEPKVVVKEATKKGYAEATVGDSINIQFPNSKTRRGRVGKGVAQTLETSCNQATLANDYRIRKLTPKECWRLMGFTDEQFYKAAYGHSIPVELIQRLHNRTLKKEDYKVYHRLTRKRNVSDSQLYKQAGNSIVVDVLYYLFKNLFINKPTEKTEPESKLPRQMKLKDFI